MAGRLPAAAGHRAAVVDDNAGSDVSIAGSILCTLYLMCEYVHIGNIGTTAIVGSLLYGKKTFCYSTAIGDIETYDDSRLRRNFASVRCESQCKASVVGQSLRPKASVRCEGRKEVSCGR